MSRNNQGYRVPYSREAFSSASAAPPQAAAGADPRHGRGRGARGGQSGGHCLICSYTQEHPKPQVPVYHRHFSSLRLREMTGVEDSARVYLCPSCKSHHQPYPTCLYPPKGRKRREQHGYMKQGRINRASQVNHMRITCGSSVYQR